MLSDLILLNEVSVWVLSLVEHVLFLSLLPNGVMGHGSKLNVSHLIRAHVIVSGSRPQFLLVSQVRLHTALHVGLLKRCRLHLNI